MKRLAILIWTLGCCIAAQAQDVHFSEFFATPLFTNPAMAGGFEGTYRYTGVVRRQWSSVTAQPYQSFAGGVDVSKPLNIEHTGIGLRLLHDHAGLSATTTMGVDVPISFRFRVGKARNMHVALAAQVGLLHLSHNTSRLSWDDQFNGTKYDPNTPTGEPLPGGSVLRPNIGAGAWVEKRISERKRIGIGYSRHNITRPNMSLTGGTARLAARDNIHLMASVPLGLSALDFMPAAQYQRQDRHRELLFGGAFRLHLSETEAENRSVQVGLWGRAKDAGYLSAGIQQNRTYFGASYDFNLSPLKTASEYLGGWEFCIIHIVSTVREKTTRTRQCPDFL